MIGIGSCLGMLIGRKQSLHSSKATNGSKLRARPPHPVRPNWQVTFPRLRAAGTIRQGVDQRKNFFMIAIPAPDSGDHCSEAFTQPADGMQYWGCLRQENDIRDIRGTYCHFQESWHMNSIFRVLRGPICFSEPVSECVSLEHVSPAC